VWGARAHQWELITLEYFYGGNLIFYDFYFIFVLEVCMDVNEILFTKKIYFSSVQFFLIKQHFLKTCNGQTFTEKCSYLFLPEMTCLIDSLFWVRNTQ
jgi:hypothetical protein